MATNAVPAKATKLVAKVVPADQKDGILISIATFLKKKQDDVRKAANLTGGWETWAQIEILIQLLIDAKTKGSALEGAKCSREDSNYNKVNEETDFMVKTKNDVTHIVELKCESLGQKSTFVDALVKDLSEANGVPSPDLNKTSVPSIFYVIGIIPEGSANNQKLDSAPYKGKFQEWTQAGIDFKTLPFRIWCSRTEIAVV